MTDVQVSLTERDGSVKKITMSGMAFESAGFIEYDGLYYVRSHIDDVRTYYRVSGIAIMTDASGDTAQFYRHLG
jgi:hypothetical protein